MKICFYKTTDLSTSKFEQIVSNFNLVFNRNVEFEYFKRTYCQTNLGFSFHSTVEDNNLIGGVFTVIPYEYLVNEKKVLIGLAVGTYIIPTFRKDPYLLRQMFEVMENNLKAYNIDFIIAIPNDNVYTYWKSVVKWKDIGNLNYYIHPINLHTLFKNRFLVPFNRLISFTLNSIIFIRKFLSNNFFEKSIRIYRDDSFLNTRLYSYNKVTSKNFSYYYKIYNEDGVRSAYIIYFFPRKISILEKCVKNLTIQRKNDIDLILYIGNLKYSPLNMIKVPSKYEPKHIHFTGRELNSKLFPDYFLDIKNWEIDLLNFDVR